MTHRDNKDLWCAWTDRMFGLTITVLVAVIWVAAYVGTIAFLGTQQYLELPWQGSVTILGFLAFALWLLGLLLVKMWADRGDWL